MGDKSRIEWTDATWNPTVGCTPVSAGCEHCYAAQMATRLAANPATPQYAGLARDGRWTGEVRCLPEKLDIPLRWTRPRRIFVDSMSDLFHPAVPFEFAAAVLGVIAACPQHEFIILTKRPERMREWFAWFPGHYTGPRRSDLPWHMPDMVKRLQAASEVPWPPPNLILGVTVESDAYRQRIADLIQCPAAARIVSYEPALGPLDLTDVPAPGSGPISTDYYDALAGHGWQSCFGKPGGEGYAPGVEFPRIDGVICGGESGPNARPMHPDWARKVRDDCAAAGVPFFFKQWGEWLPDNQCFGETWVVKPGHPGAPAWAIDKPVCHLSSGLHAFKVGKATAGHLLDGREHREWPRKAER